MLTNQKQDKSDYLFLKRGPRRTIYIYKRDCLSKNTAQS